MFAVGISLNCLAHNGQLGLARSCGVPVFAFGAFSLRPCSKTTSTWCSLNPICVRDFCADRLHGTESSPPAGAPKRTATRCSRPISSMAGRAWSAC